MKHRTIATVGILAFLVLPMMPALSAPQKVETKDGVRIIHNVQPGKWGTTSKVRLDPVRIIGDSDTDDENLAFNMPNDLAEDSRGNIYIADSSNARIQKFTKEGTFVASLGRKGQGPGEFNSIRSLAVDADDRLFAFDASQRRLTILTTEGKEVRTIRFVKSPISGLRLMKDVLFLSGWSPIDGRSSPRKSSGYPCPGTSRARPSSTRGIRISGPPICSSSTSLIPRGFSWEASPSRSSLTEFGFSAIASTSWTATMASPTINIGSSSADSLGLPTNCGEELKRLFPPFPSNPTAGGRFFH